MLKLLLILLVFRCSSVFNDMIFPKKREYKEVILDRFEKLFETPEIAMWDLKIRKVNKIRSCIGNVSIKAPFGNEYNVDIKMLKKQGGEFRYLPYRLPTSRFCDALAADTYVWPDILAGSNLPSDCPMPAGEYQIYNVSTDMEKIPQGVLQNGEYTLETSFTKGKTLISKYRFYAYVNVV